jgi:phosphonate transport system permease protein
MAAETDATDSPPDGTSDEIQAVRERIYRQRVIRWALIAVGALAVLLLVFFSLVQIGFTVAEIVRQFWDWMAFVYAFFQPEFQDVTQYSHENGITSEGSLVPFSVAIAEFINRQAGEQIIANPRPFDPLGALRPIIASLAAPTTFVESLTDQRNLMGASLVTIMIGFAGTVVGLPMALTFGILGSERVTPFPFNFLFRGTMSTIRAVPALVWILIYVPLVGISPVGAFLAVMTDTIGNLGRLFTDELEEIEDGPIEAIQSTGASRPETILFGMLSQVKNGFIAWTLYILEINTRIAISLGVVGAGGIGQYISLNVQQFNYGKAATGILMVIVIVISVELISSRLRARLRPGENSGKGFVEAIKDLGDGGKWMGTGS